MNNINIWLENFKKYWLNKEINLVIELFSDNVEYYETPFYKFNNKNEILSAWKYINKQNISYLDFDIFSVEKDKFTIEWELKYNIEEKQFHFKGIYLMTLNSENKCNYFIQYWEKV